MLDDYGYFGKGVAGYAHYMQAFEQSFGKAGRAAYGTETDEADEYKLEENETETETDELETGESDAGVDDWSF